MHTSRFYWCCISAEAVGDKIHSSHVFSGRNGQIRETLLLGQQNISRETKEGLGVATPRLELVLLTFMCVYRDSTSKSTDERMSGNSRFNRTATRSATKLSGSQFIRDR